MIMRKVGLPSLCAVVVGVYLALLPCTVWAQSISGTVTNPADTGLSGVVVEATSPALAGAVRTTTDAQGRYTLWDLRPGFYTVIFTRPGFGSVRRQEIEVLGVSNTELPPVRLTAAPATGSTTGQPAPSMQNVEWRTYGNGLANTRYSPLDQINASSFDKLQVAWRFKTDNLGPRPNFTPQTTPLMIKGRLYFTAGARRAAVCLDAATGELKWVYNPDEGRRAEVAFRKGPGRAVAYWTDGTDERIVYVTPAYKLVALNASTGQPVPDFGTGGTVDLKLEMDQEMDLITGDVGLNGGPLIAGDVIVVGSSGAAGLVPKSRRNEKSFIRGYDVRTGRRLWIFHTVPFPGEFGSETWRDDSNSYTGNTGAWAMLAADEELGLVYIPTEAPTGDYYGGHRHGANLFSDTILALDLKTGTRVWHFQAIHHDIWDWDLPSPPILADIVVEGRPIKAIAQPSKQGWLYVLDRTNGKPVWPIEERPVPKGDVPGEYYSPTQPFPTKPPAFARQGVTIDDLIDFTPELRAEAEKVIAPYKLGPIFTPPVVSRWEGPRGAVQVPSFGGGANWPGGSLDPESNRLYVVAGMGAGGPILGLIHDPARSDMNFILGMAPPPQGQVPPAGGLDVQGLPLMKPPYAQLSAIDLDTGDIVWQVPHGETPDAVRNHPALKGLTIPRTGRGGSVGTLVTKTLLIAGESGFFTTPNNQRGAMLRAYDKATGQEVGAVYMPAPQTGSPMTYMVDGTQFIVVAIGGASYGGELLAFKLPPD